jgi:hypothetical protein
MDLVIFFLVTYVVALSSESLDPLMILPRIWLSVVTRSQVSDFDLPKSLISSQSHTPSPRIMMLFYQFSAYPCGLMDVVVVFGSLMSLKAYQSRCHGWFLLISNVVSIFG